MPLIRLRAPIIKCIMNNEAKNRNSQVEFNERTNSKRKREEHTKQKESKINKFDGIGSTIIDRFYSYTMAFDLSVFK